MTLPHCVLNTLNAQQIDYQLADISCADKMAELRTPEAGNQQLAVMVVLEGSENHLQAVVSSNSLINLDIVGDQTGQQLKGLSCKDREELLNNNGLKELPAIPALTGYQTFVDSKLLTADRIFIASGNRENVIELNQANFAKLIDGSEKLDFGVHIFDLPAFSNCRQQDNDDIYAAIRNYTSLQIQKRLHDTLEIPPLSSTAKKILALSADPNADIEDLVQIIELDPSLAAQVVGWAASPYYSAPGKVKSIHDAIVRVLGFELVMNLALGLAMGQSLKVPSNGACAISLFWRQAIYCALTMEKLNRITPANKRGQAGLAYLAGLMNNFGYLIFNHVFPSHFSSLCQYMNANPHINPLYIEKHLLGITSEQMCGLLAEAWNLPTQINNALRFKQAPLYDGDDANYANLCFLSTRLLAEMGVGNLPAEVVPDSIYDALELDPQAVQDVMHDLLESQEQIEVMLSSLAA